MEPEDDIDHVLAFARELAEALETSDRNIALQIARRSVESDAEASEIFVRLDAVGRQIQEALARGEEPPRELREELTNLRDSACANHELWELLRRQADYIELLRVIDGLVFRKAPRMGRRLG